MLGRVIDFIPALAFFITYYATFDLVLATGVIMIGTVTVSSIQYLRKRKLSRMQVFLLCAVLAFGIPTFLLNDPEIIKMKATVVCVIFASFIIFSQYILKRNPIGYLIGPYVPAPDFIWLKVGNFFIWYFLFCAALNVVIAYYLPTLFGIDAKYAEALWVNYKTFGSTILNVVTSGVFMVYLYTRYPEFRAALVEADRRRTAGKQAPADEK